MRTGLHSSGPQRAKHQTGPSGLAASPALPLSSSGVLGQLSKPWLHQFHPVERGRPLLELLQGLGRVQSGKFLQWLSQDAHQVCLHLRNTHLKQRPNRMVCCLPQVSAAWAGDTHARCLCGHGGSHCCACLPRWEVRGFCVHGCCNSPVTSVLRVRS